MPFFAANGVPVISGWSAQAQFPQGGGSFPFRFTKLDVFANGTDVVFQALEQAGGWSDDQAQEGLLRMGFDSVPFETPIIAVRFKVWSGTLLASSGTVDIKLFG